MRFLRVKNLEKYQHYKDRNPPWVKLYYSLLDDPAFIALNEVDRHHYILCILIASRQNNCIPHDPTYLARVMRLTGEVDVTPLIRAGFLVAHCKRNFSRPIAEPNQTAISEREKETERESREMANDEFEQFWNLFPMRNGKRLGKPEALAKFRQLNAGERPLVFMAVRNYAASEMIRNGIGVKDVHLWLRNGRESEPWRDWIEPEQPTIKMIAPQKKCMRQLCGGECEEYAMPGSNYCTKHKATLVANQKKHGIMATDAL